MRPSLRSSLRRLTSKDIASGHEAAPFAAARTFSHDVLLVEDDPTMRQTLGQFLALSGYSVLTAPDGRAALQTLANQLARLIITDIFMPETDGFELLTELREASVNSPIVVMTGGYGGERKLSLDVARHLGAARLLAKPFGLGQLLAVVNELIGYPAPRTARSSSA